MRIAGGYDSWRSTDRQERPMRALAKWMIWWLVSVVGAAAGVLLGYIAAVIVFPILAFVAERWQSSGRTLIQMIQ
jgi:hypothetical protein